MSKNKYTFTIITCTHNSDGSLPQCLNSVFIQKYRDFEHIFIDGFSKDKTIAFIKRYKDKLPNQVKLFSYKPTGISDAFNAGIKQAKGKYLFFLNSDDSLYDKDVLEDVAKYIDKNRKLDWFYGKIRVTEEDGREVGIFPQRKFFQLSSSNLLKFINFVPHQGVFMKSEIFYRYGGFDSKLKLNMDTDLFLRISKKTSWDYFDRVICDYVISSKSQSSSYANKNLGLSTLESVQKRHLSRLELFIAKIINKFLFRINKIYR